MRREPYEKRQEVVIPNGKKLPGRWSSAARWPGGNRERSVQPLALVDTHGCQQNEADSEQIRGCSGRWATASPRGDTREADVIVINTCAIREHAELRVLGNVGPSPTPSGGSRSR